MEGTNSAYSVDTFGRPRRISIDPNNQVLQNSQELQVRTSIMRGQQDVEQGDLTEALKEYQKALDLNRNSSLAHYRIAEVFFEQHNYQSAANAYREALNGDGIPRWTEVWSHIQLGMIFDLTGQRQRATNEYRQALQTNDNTQNALDTARKYLSSPYNRKAAATSRGCSLVAPVSGPAVRQASSPATIRGPEAHVQPPEGGATLAGCRDGVLAVVHLLFVIPSEERSLCDRTQPRDLRFILRRVHRASFSPLNRVPPTLWDITKT